jgi:hypothetical protein
MGSGEDWWCGRGDGNWRAVCKIAVDDDGGDGRSKFTQLVDSESEGNFYGTLPRGEKVLGIWGVLRLDRLGWAWY